MFAFFHRGCKVHCSVPGATKNSIKLELSQWGTLAREAIGIEDK
jgi:hypothetical protein